MKRNRLKFIIITGSAGYVGSSLIEYLKSEGDYKIIGIDKEPKSLPRTKGNYYFKADLRKEDEVSSTFEKISNIIQSPSPIIHAAALFVKDFKKRNKFSDEDYIENNVVALNNVIKHVKKHDLSNKFIFLSTAISKKPSGKKENGQESGELDTYSKTKWEGEKIIRTLHIPWYIVRPVRVIGLSSKYRKKSVNSKIDGKEFIKNFKKRLSNQQIPFDIVSTFVEKSFSKNGTSSTLKVKPGNLERTYVHISDVASALEKLAFDSVHKKTIVNIATSQPITLGEIATLVVSKLNKIGYNVRLLVTDDSSADRVFIKSSTDFDWTPNVDPSSEVIKKAASQYISSVALD